MIIDNKHNTEDTDIKTVWDYLLKHTSSGNLNIVTGYFTISALCLLKKFKEEPHMFRLILGEIAGNAELQDRVINIISGDTSISNGFKLTVSAKRAIEFLKQDNVLVRLINSNFCHAKTYIYEDNTIPGSCYFVNGSSNLTESGLGTNPAANIELNIADDGWNKGNFKSLLEWFERTWAKEALEKVTVLEEGNKVQKTVKQYFIDVIQNLYRDYTPKDIYYKILYELFNNDIDAYLHDATDKRIIRLEETVIWNTLFEYQRKGVKSLIQMLNKYNGAILADAVGLGKTFSALAVIKYFQNEGYSTILLCPKKLEHNWQQYRHKANSRFEADRFDYEVRFHTDLQDERLHKNYQSANLSWIQSRPKLLIVIDESHNLRNDKSGRYQYLLEHILSETIKSDIKVLELSATPINTNINDVRNQFKLFVRGRDNGFDGPDFEIPSLSELFKAAQKVLNDWSSDNNRKIRDLVTKLPNKFFNLTDRLVVARTRNMIEKSEGKSLGFPIKNMPINRYLGVQQIGHLKSFDEIYKALLEPMLTAYKPNAYTKRAGDGGFGDPRLRDMFLVRMMLTLFLKRLESSWVACKTTVEKVLAHHENTLAKVDNYIKYKQDANVGEEIYDDDFALGKKNPVALSEIVDIQAFRRDLEKDVLLLKAFVKNIRLYHDQFYSGEVKDEKLECLKQIVADKVNRSKKKVLIFTTYSDTAHYLYNQLNTIFPGKVACVDGEGATFNCAHNKDFQETLMRFAPISKMYNGYDWTPIYKEYFPEGDGHFKSDTRKWEVKYHEWKKIIAASDHHLAKYCRKLLAEPINVLIATDCLSEGQNLQDAQTVINYDIHWNPVRIIQRVGRIDRIGSENKKIDCYNFWPAESYDAYLQLVERINNRMATMALVGTETIDVTEKLKKQLADNPIIDRNDRKLLEQLQHTVDDAVESETNFGLQDLSFENFRQDLLDFLGEKGDELKNMPNGSYSGFKTTDSAFKDVPESIVALVASPHKPVGAIDHKYKEFWLILRSVDNNESSVTAKVFNRQEILAMLRYNMEKVRNVPAPIDRGDSSAIGKLTSIMEEWIREQVSAENHRLIKDLFSGDLNPIIRCKDIKLEEKFRSDNLDIICWEYITK